MRRPLGVSAPHEETADVPPGRECRVRPHLLSLRRQRRLHRRPPRPLRGRPGFGRCRMAGVLPEPEGRPPRDREERRGPVLEAAHMAACRRRADRGARRRLERGRESARRQDQGQAQSRGVELSAADVQQATRDFGARADADPRLPHARPLSRQSRPARHRGPEETTRSSIRAPTASPKPIYDRQIFLDKVLGLEFATLREIVDILRRTYCQTLGVEFMHISDPEQKGWIQERIEGPDKEITFTREGKRAILNKLVEAEGFEKFCDLKFTGTKRFGLDGGESMIPALEQIIKRGGALGVKEIVIGMAHRGRLNVLAQVMGKPHRAIFHEFKGGSSTPDDVEGSGDVKYHLGASSDREFDGNKVHLSLTANPSHLEIVNPVVLGKVRAKQDQRGATPRGPHDGDAAADLGRRGVRRPGRDRRMLRAFRPARPPHRRLGAFHRQQPDRLHHLSALFALVAVSVGRREDDRGADLPRERRRSGSGGVRRQDRDRVPAEVPEAGRHRHVLLPALRPQRGRRAGVHPAADVQEDPPASVDAGDLFQEADRGRRRHRRRGREDARRLARAARRRAGGEPELQAQQRRLARRPLDRHEAGRRVRRSAARQHRCRARDAEGDRPQDHDDAGRLPRPPDHPAFSRRPVQGDRNRTGHRLGDR